MHVPDLVEHSIVVQEGEFLWRLEQRKKEERLALERSATEERIRAMVTLAQVHSTPSSTVTLTELPCTTTNSSHGAVEGEAQHLQVLQVRQHW